MAELLASQEYSRWQQNVVQYLRFGDFRDKAVHPGVNLTGPNPRLTSELMTVRSYRSSMIQLGRVFDVDMTPKRNKLLDATAPIEVDSKPGVYAIFLSAYLANIDAYKLSLDKVHSDYSGVPLALMAGSRMENGIEPRVSADNANRALAELAFAFYIGETGQASIRTFGLR
ncbi:hypothetical protein Mycch_5653 (plasmid) [Mycolicibacterium chubuense NBB4]|uniref:Uncharacterized protein n=2 Tax=Mycolicibacterium chubuense TaxID=1800 RepID=I4BSN1_MYCCN|nr:hypothetical protein Mycch_5653 [Mycolicibacterium chubuense NBB4]